MPSSSADPEAPPPMKKLCSFACRALCVAAGLTLGFSTQAAAPEKKPPRPERTASERADAARQLREVYRREQATWPAPHVDPGVE